MGKLSGIFQFSGTVGGVTVDKNGTVRQKRAGNKAAFKGAASQSRTRENAAEFGAAGSAGKLLRDALRSALQGVSDRFATGRITKLMREIIGLDTVNGRGMRLVKKAAAALKLLGLNFNLNAPLGTVFHAVYGAAEAGAVTTLTIADFVPTRDVTAPQGATHVEIVAAGAAIDFENGTSTVAVVSAGAGVLPIDATSTDATVTLTLPAAPGATENTVAVLGVSFYQEVNGVFYAINNGGSNPLAIVYAS